LDLEKMLDTFVFIKLIFYNQNVHETLEKWLHIEEFITFPKVTFYTVRFERDSEMDEMSETDKFFHKFENNPKYTRELDTMSMFLKKIGEKFGAHKDLFRHERSADALPPKIKMMARFEFFDFFETDDIKRRLYCLRLSDSVVILFNGGFKTNDDPEKCDNVRPHFKDAQIFAKRINEKLNYKDFLLSKGRLTSNDELAFRY
jgi:hypothetical protein